VIASALTHDRFLLVFLVLARRNVGDAETSRQHDGDSFCISWRGGQAHMVPVIGDF
jgi:hypothetical protein